MPVNPYSRGRARSRRSAPQTDAIVIALTAQVLVCILLLLAAALAQKVDETRYDNVKRQYTVLVTDPTGSNEVFEDLGQARGGLGQVFESIEEFIDSLIRRFTGGAETAAPPVAEVVPEPHTEDPGTQPDSPPQEAEQETEQEQSTVLFDYNYLEPDTEEASFASLGQGGMFPVATGGQDTSGLPAPEGCTFATVQLRGVLRPPLTGVVTSEFAYRDHPVTGKSDFHNGIDIAAVEGRDILAALPGTVVEVGQSEIYGNYITLEHAQNLQTFYAHCSSIIAQEGMVVRQGERIAQVGQTGVATGPHLHFSVLVDGLYTDPYWVLSDHIRVVDAL